MSVALWVSGFAAGAGFMAFASGDGQAFWPGVVFASAAAGWLLVAALLGALRETDSAALKAQLVPDPEREVLLALEDLAHGRSSRTAQSTHTDRANDQ